MDKKRRIKYIDLCKGLGILMVTWGHITKLDNPVDTWAASFKMAIFFVAAGYLIRYADSYRTQTLKGYSVKLLKSLMLPYVLFSILSIGFRFATMIMKHRIDIPAINLVFGQHHIKEEHLHYGFYRCYLLRISCFSVLSNIFRNG